VIGAFVLCWGFFVFASIISIGLSLAGDGVGAQFWTVASSFPATAFLWWAPSKISNRPRTPLDVGALAVFSVVAAALAVPNGAYSSKLQAIEGLVVIALLGSYSIIVVRVAEAIRDHGSKRESVFWPALFVFFWPLTAFAIQKKLNQISLDQTSNRDSRQ
jgi:hypothetical protein